MNKWLCALCFILRSPRALDSNLIASKASNFNQNMFDAFDVAETSSHICIVFLLKYWRWFEFVNKFNAIHQVHSFYCKLSKKTSKTQRKKQLHKTKNNGKIYLIKCENRKENQQYRIAAYGKSVWKRKKKLIRFVKENRDSKRNIMSWCTQLCAVINSTQNKLIWIRELDDWNTNVNYTIIELEIHFRLNFGLKHEQELTTIAALWLYCVPSSLAHFFLKL